ncbi:hypothetical protein [Bradyrhizobium centrosematis]|uniref:hypothetical protein n=1 Tax=Bradyrhizobium centrosematis TaxID=1300039 RepID=UPI002169E46E|nr:hypothetical protein [Bradyrhizobium centrosematis]MCS3765344.1 hypothetical protein [Bradyrhizobium centrosematis]MCS3773956.1 hypothetical protein [Bradyrhizobium centrosematis]
MKYKDFPAAQWPQLSGVADEGSQGLLIYQYKSLNDLARLESGAWRYYRIGAQLAAISDHSSKFLHTRVDPLFAMNN